MRTRRAIQGTQWFGIPVTGQVETVVDLAAALTDDELARVCHEAAVKHHLRPAQVDAVLVRRHNATGGANFRAVLNGDTPVSLSALERRFLSLIDEAGLPRPITNKPPAPNASTAAGRASPDGRARLVWLPQLPLLLGAGPPPRARGPRAR